MSICFFPYQHQCLYLWDHSDCHQNRDENSDSSAVFCKQKISILWGTIISLKYACIHLNAVKLLSIISEETAGGRKMIKMGKHSVCQEDEKKTIKDEHHTFSTYAYKNNQQEVSK